VGIVGFLCTRDIDPELLMRSPANFPAEAAAKFCLQPIGQSYLAPPSCRIQTQGAPAREEFAAMSCSPVMLKNLISHTMDNFFYLSLDFFIARQLIS
jgi:hypothetical protein